MQIKQFAADTIDEVLAQVRAELGEDALILQTKRVVRGGVGGFFGKEGVEVTAAAGADPAAANMEAAASVAAPSLDVLDTPEAEVPATPALPAPAPPADEPAEDPFRRHLDGRLAAAGSVISSGSRLSSTDPSAASCASRTAVRAASRIARPRSSPPGANGAWRA